LLCISIIGTLLLNILLIPDNHIDTRDTINVDTSNPINWRRVLDHHITQFNHELTSDPDMTYIATSKLTQPEIDRSGDAALLFVLLVQ